MDNESVCLYDMSSTTMQCISADEEDSIVLADPDFTYAVQTSSHFKRSQHCQSPLLKNEPVFLSPDTHVMPSKTDMMTMILCRLDNIDERC